MARWLPLNRGQTALVVAGLVAPFVACVVAVGPLVTILKLPVDVLTAAFFVGIYTVWGFPAAAAFGYLGLTMARRTLRDGELSAASSAAAGAASASVYILACLALTLLPGFVANMVAPWIGFISPAFEFISPDFENAREMTLAPAFISVASILLGGAVAGWVHHRFSLAAKD